jgi:hypothetical protein
LRSFFIATSFIETIGTGRWPDCVAEALASVPL